MKFTPNWPPQGSARQSAVMSTPDTCANAALTYETVVVVAVPFTGLRWIATQTDWSGHRSGSMPH